MIGSEKTIARTILRFTRHYVRLRKGLVPVKCCLGLSIHLIRAASGDHCGRCADAGSLPQPRTTNHLIDPPRRRVQCRVPRAFRVGRPGGDSDGRPPRDRFSGFPAILRSHAPRSSSRVSASAIRSICRPLGPSSRHTAHDFIGSPSISIARPLCTWAFAEGTTDAHKCLCASIVTHTQCLLVPVWTKGSVTFNR